MWTIKKIKLDDIEKGLIISFFDNDYLEGFDCDHDNSLVITATIHNYAVKRILVDQGSPTNILHSVATASMNINKIDLKPYNRNLIGFSDK